MFAFTAIRFVKEMIKSANKKVVTARVKNKGMEPSHLKPRCNRSCETAKKSTSTQPKKKMLEFTSSTMTSTTPCRPLVVRKSWTKIMTRLPPSTALTNLSEEALTTTSHEPHKTKNKRKEKEPIKHKSKQKTSIEDIKENQLIKLPGAIIPMIPGVKSIEAFHTQKQQEATLFRSLRRAICKKKRLERNAQKELENKIREEQSKLWEANHGRGVWRVVRSSNNGRNKHKTSKRKRASNKKAQNNRQLTSRSTQRITKSSASSKTRSNSIQRKKSKETHNVVSTMDKARKKKSVKTKAESNTSTLKASSTIDKINDNYSNKAKNAKRNVAPQQRSRNIITERFKFFRSHAKS